MTNELTPANFQSALDSAIGKNFGFAKDISKNYMNEIASLGWTVVEKVADDVPSVESMLAKCGWFSIALFLELRWPIFLVNSVDKWLRKQHPLWIESDKSFLQDLVYPTREYEYFITNVPKFPFVVLFVHASDGIDRYVFRVLVWQRTKHLGMNVHSFVSR